MKSGKYRKMIFIAEKSLEIEHTHEVLMILKEWPQKPLRKTVKSSGWFYKIVWIHSEKIPHSSTLHLHLTLFRNSQQIKIRCCHAKVCWTLNTITNVLTNKQPNRLKKIFNLKVLTKKKVKIISCRI